MSEFDRKYTAALAELSKSGIWRSNANPPYLKLLRWVGLRPRPPHYQRFKSNLIGFGVWFAAAWGLLMWFLIWRSTDMPIVVTIATACSAGVFFGLAMGAYYARSHRKNNLSRWEDL